LQIWVYPNQKMLILDTIKLLLDVKDRHNNCSRFYPKCEDEGVLIYQDFIGNIWFRFWKNYYAIKRKAMEYAFVLKGSFIVWNCFRWTWRTRISSTVDSFDIIKLCWCILIDGKCQCTCNKIKSTLYSY
jgi:hypothetical protein